MRNAGLKEVQAGIKIARRNISNLRYADDTTLMAESAGATKRASPRGEAGTSGFPSVSDSDRRVPAELGQESQASSCLRKGSMDLSLSKLWGMVKDREA